MFNFLILNLFFVAAPFIRADVIPSLPDCSDTESVLVIVSTLDGKLSALNYSGSLVWEVTTGPGPLLLSNIHTLELTNNGEWVRIIPSLTGTLYKFDGTTVDPILISAEELLKSSFRYSDDLVISGGIEIRTYGVGFRTGTVFYECTSLKCSNNNKQAVDDLILIERSTHTIRAVESRTGNERWNYSVGLHNVKLHRVSCINNNIKLFDCNLTAVVPEGKLRANITQNGVEYRWQYIFSSPIVRVWKWSGRDLSELNIFSPTNVPQVTSSVVQPSIYIGMHHKQLYIHESITMQQVLYRKPHTNVTIAETKSVAKIPWKPVSASTESTEDDSTALSVLNESEYVNGHGFYLYTESDLKKKDISHCESNRSFVGKINPEAVKIDIFHSYVVLWWKEVILMSITIFICHILFRFWHGGHKNQEIIIIEKPVGSQIITNRISERENEGFTSRFMNDFDTVQCLGRGGFGVVFQVKQKIDMCHYAIKRITLPNQPNSKDRVMREVIALAKLDHPNIVRYFNSWVEYPPMGWQKVYDPILIRDKSLFLEDDSYTTEGVVKGSKFVSVNINSCCDKDDSDVPINELDIEDDSFIVFENSERELSGESKVSEPSNISRRISSISDLKNIDWKRPRRRHHSLDSTSNSFLNPTDPPVFLYIQMQLCKKESLKEWLSKNKKRDYNFVIDIFNQILNAVQYVHLRGLIHRDLKPGNILFSLDDVIKVGDFGLVKDMEDAFDLELLKKGAHVSYKGHTVEVGTQLYMSPEQFHTRIYDYKIDIYSLGLIFFELLVPFDTEMERIKMLTNIKNNIYPDEFSQNFPKEHILLQSMLCEDPNKRLTTIGIRARPPFNHQDSGYNEDCHYRLTNFQKT